MYKRVLFITAVFLIESFLWAGDTAVFVDLGFSPDGKTYMFGQYGVQSETLRPWADLYIVDVPNNNYVPGGRISYTHDGSVVPGQDGSGALYRLIARNTALADRYSIGFLFQGQPLYISSTNGAGPSGESIEFRDFEKSASFRANLSILVEGTGTNARSSFFINLERRGNDGSVRKYTVGSPQIKRQGVTGYQIRKVMVAPGDGSVIFVIEMKKQNVSGGVDIRYMVEALRL
jgi:predicted secreted protein